MPKHIVVADEREAQLRQIASDHNVSTADAVSLLIRWAIEAGKVAPGLPDYSVTRQGNLIVADMAGIVRTMSLEEAEAVAGAIQLIAEPKRSAFIEAAKALTLANPLVANELRVKRRGSSIKITGDEGFDKTLSHSVALDLVEMIRAALK